MDIWEEHPRVVHYTTQHGLKGILDSQSLHATHYKSLNDTTEMYRLRPALMDAIKTAIRPISVKLANNPKFRTEVLQNIGSIDKFVDGESKIILDTMYEVTFGISTDMTFFEPYIVSFCGHTEPYDIKNGLLSQWRAYSRDSGYAIIFDTEKLSSLQNKEASEFFMNAGFFGDVIYDNDKEKIESEFSDLFQKIQSLIPELVLGNSPDMLELFTPFAGSVSRCKHHGFQEESEVRLLLSPWSKNDLEQQRLSDPKNVEGSKKIKRVHFDSGFVPYIKLFEDIDENLPIQSIIVGPHMDKEERKSKL